MDLNEIKSLLQALAAALVLVVTLDYSHSATSFTIDDFDAQVAVILVVPTTKQVGPQSAAILTVTVARTTKSSLVSLQKQIMLSFGLPMVGRPIFITTTSGRLTEPGLVKTLQQFTLMKDCSRTPRY